MSPRPVSHANRAAGMVAEATQVPACFACEQRFPNVGAFDPDDRLRSHANDLRRAPEESGARGAGRRSTKVDAYGSHANPGLDVAGAKPLAVGRGALFSHANLLQRPPHQDQSVRDVPCRTRAGRPSQVHRARGRNRSAVSHGNGRLPSYRAQRDSGRRRFGGRSRLVVATARSHANEGAVSR